MGDLLRSSDYILSDKVGRLLRPGPVDDPARFWYGRPAAV